MPAKSRRNRRNIPRSKDVASNPISSNTVAAASTEAAMQEKTGNSFNAAARAAAPVNPALTYPYILSEIKWISVVTAIIAVIIVVLYIFLH